MHVLAEHRDKMDHDQIANRLLYLLQVMETNEGLLAALIQALYAYARVPFASTPSMGWWRRMRLLIRGRD